MWRNIEVSWKQSFGSEIGWNNTYYKKTMIFYRKTSRFILRSAISLLTYHLTAVRISKIKVYLVSFSEEQKYYIPI